jgi:hypothetical protein
MVGMNMGLQRELQLEPQFANKRAVPRRLLEHGIDEHGLPAIAIPDQIGIGRRLRIEELSEYGQGNPLGRLGVIGVRTCRFPGDWSDDDSTRSLRSPPAIGPAAATL